MYEFEDLPLSPIEPATNVLVAGPAMGGTRELFLRMLSPEDGEGTVVVSTTTGTDDLFTEFGDVAPGVGADRVGVVDAVSRQHGVDADEENVRSVASPRDLTGIGMELTDLYERFFEDGVPRLRTGLDSISTLLMYAELRTVFRFLHVFTGRVSTADGLGVFVIDPSSHDDQTTQTLTQLFDGRIDVRSGDGGPQLRVEGLAGQPDEWAAF